MGRKKKNIDAESIENKVIKKPTKKKSSVKLSQEESDAKINLTNNMLKIMEFEPTDKFPTIFQKKLYELKESYSFVEINYAITQLNNQLCWAVNNKEFKNDYNKINYLMAIIQNNINQYKKELKEINKNQEILSQNNNDIDLLIINENNFNKQPKKIDMSEYLD